MTANAQLAPPLVKSLAYVGYETRDAGAWDVFLKTIFGLERRGDSPDQCSQYRLDDHHHRISVYPGDQEKVSHLGWEMASRESLAELERQLKDRGIPVQRGTRALAAERGVLEVLCFANPDGMTQEACVGVGTDDKPFLPTRAISGFLTGDMGMGHVAIMTKDHEATATWYQDLFGFRISDVVEIGPLQASFLHCNGRHHSLGLISELPGMFPAGTIHHLMLEANGLDDVGRGYDIALEQGTPIAHTLGQHSNDRMTSFYAYTPSGNQIEYGFGGLIVDDATWTQKYFNSGDLWGHKMQPPPAGWAPQAV